MKVFNVSEKLIYITTVLSPLDLFVVFVFSGDVYHIIGKYGRTKGHSAKVSHD